MCPFCGASACYVRTMRQALDLFRLPLISVAGCLNQRQQDFTDYFQEENRVLCQQVGGKRLRFATTTPTVGRPGQQSGSRMLSGGCPICS